MKILKEVLRQNRTAILLFLVMTAVNAAVLALYGILTEPLIYDVLLTFFVLVAILTAGFLREKRRSAERVRIREAILSQWRALPEPESLAGEEYQQMITALGEELERIMADASAERQDMLDYYTAWVHHIKTPIAVMRLKLSDDSPEHHALSAELQRIEQYVEMVLQYIRIGSETNDLVIK